MSGCASECSFQVEVGVAAWKWGLSKPLFGPCRKVARRGFVDDPDMRWALGLKWDMAGLWGIMQLALVKENGAAESRL